MVDTPRYDFGPYRLDSAERLLTRAGQPVHLTPKAFDLLVALVERHGRLVTKNELMTAVWPDTHVEETNLAFTVSALRKALGNGEEADRFIQTVPTRGYRFVASLAQTAEEWPSIDKSSPHRHRLARRLAALLTLLCIIALVAVLVPRLRISPAPRTPARLSILLPHATVATDAAPNPQISPDGRHVAFTVVPGSRIWLQDIAEGSARSLGGTENAQGLFWSPNSQELAFTTPSAVKKLRLSNGRIETLCDRCVPSGGGTWGSTGLIVFPTRTGELDGVSDAGAPRPVINLRNRSAGEIAHSAPQFLPNGEHFLFVIRNADESKTGLYVGKLGSSNRQLLIPGDTAAIYASPGYLLFLRGRTLMAQQFDPSQLQLHGEARAIVLEAPSLQNSMIGQPAFSVSDSGVLTYAVDQRPLTQFQWVGRSGEPHERVGQPGAYYAFDLSVDDRQLAYAQIEAGDGNLRVLDLERQIVTPLTIGSSLYTDPRWLPGEQLVATRWRPAPRAIVQISRDGRQSPLPHGMGAWPEMLGDVSRDGQHLLSRMGQRLATVTMRTRGVSGRVSAGVVDGLITQAQFSSDNRWIAYQQAEESRGPDVYVAHHPPTGERWKVSSNGGVQPVWRRDGRELFFLGLDGTLNVVEFRSGAQPMLSTPKPLFKTGLTPPAVTIKEYTVTRDGQRFMFLKPIEHRAHSHIGVIINWTAALSTGSSD